MILKKITLNNIRSYKNQSIVFPKGSTLLSGDIGSGKTSILLGIEFALFGLQPGQRGSSILRNGEDQGRVIVKFEIDGKEIIIEKTLKRGKTISQDYCSITIEGSKKELSVTELKNKVLEILNYPKEFAKKQNLLYKFTVYTPQEEMKQIILQDPETRINTLRHIFGIDKYKRILENISILTSKLREEKRIKQALIYNLEQDKLVVVEKENELESKHYNLSSIEKELFLKTEIRKKIQEEKEEISLKIDEKKTLEGEIAKTNIMLSNKKETSLNHERMVKKLKLEIESLNDQQFEDSKINELEIQIRSLKIEREKLNEDNLEVSSQISSLLLKNKESELLKENLKKIEMCPTCLQDVDSSYKANVSNKLDSDISGNVFKIKNLTLEKNKISNKIFSLKQKISECEKMLQDFKILKIRFENFKEKETRITELRNLNSSIEKDISLLEEQLSFLKTAVFQLNKFDGLFEAKKRDLEEALNQERIVEIKVAELKKEIEVFSKQIEELKEKIKKTEQIRKELIQISELESWISQKFVFLVSFIERNVMLKLKSDFSRLFQEWFSMLVSGIFNVGVRDDFTPIIEQHDYEIDYAYLSGGERTAIALAYRLALNQVINSLLSKIKTKNFVILDEPTDGFSDQQLDKMRNVLEQLNVDQLIIVSHEQKIESFVENVIRFEKNHDVSRMS
ncbi:MAG: AAA family ATPase [Nanoarchaeota archaeon]|nr:AAA family ATPase [Nanoarchaeota archaeon]MBU1027430.1 AAA family ATPase [Nanoarchaeota archaeon]